MPSEGALSADVIGNAGPTTPTGAPFSIWSGCGCCGGDTVPCQACDIPAVDLTVNFNPNDTGVCDWAHSGTTSVILTFNPLTTSWLGLFGPWAPEPPFGGDCLYQFQLGCVRGTNTIAFQWQDRFGTVLQQLVTASATSYTCSPFKIEWAPPPGILGILCSRITIMP